MSIIESEETVRAFLQAGIGLSINFIDQIFGLFNKLDTDAPGSGIGLTLVKRIIEVQSGKIWVESKLGQCSTFYFTLAYHQRRKHVRKIHTYS